MTAPSITTPEPFGDKALYRIPEVIHRLNISRTVVYELIRTKRLRTVHIGRACRVPATAIADYIALLENESTRPEGQK